MSIEEATDLISEAKRAREARGFMVTTNNGFLFGFRCLLGQERGANVWE